MTVRGVERVVVVGRDAPLWIAAVSLKTALGRAGVEVQVVQLPSLLSPVDVYAALPSLQALHRLIGIDEPLLLEAAQGLPMVGQRFSNWSGSAPPFIHAFDTPPQAGSDLEFVHYWTKARGEGLKVALEDFSLGAVAARSGRVPAPPDDPSQPSAGYGYHLDAISYTSLLRQLAAHRRIAITSGSISDIELAGASIAAVHLASGERIEADVFVDASGPEAVLLSRLPGSDLESWADLLPCDRVLTATAQRLDPLPAFSQISAFRAGWTGLFPLADRTGVVAVYDSRTMSDDDLVQSLPILARVPIAGDALVTNLRPGVRRNSWIGNCVAVGEAAIALEPLDAVQLHLAHLTVTNLIALFPVETGNFAEAQAYNRLVRAHAENLRDFQFAHYRLNRRFDEPLWDVARDVPVPATLAPKLAMFRRRALALLHDYETFEGANWTAILVGHGLIPEDYDPRVDLLSEAEHIARVQDRLRIIGATVPSYATVSEHMAAAATHAAHA